MKTGIWLDLGIVSHMLARLSLLVGSEPTVVSMWSDLAVSQHATLQQS